jgi:hypothetical protein
MLEIVFEDVDAVSFEHSSILDWYSKVANQEEKVLGDLTIIFCSDDYLLEVNVENLTDDSIIYVTTKDFVIKRGEEVLDSNEIFKAWQSPDQETHYIEFARLRPKISDSIPGEKLHFTCKLSYGTSKENAMYNCVSACSYGYSVDKKMQDKILDKKRGEWEKAGLNVGNETKNWLLLEGQRVVLENSFDYIIQSIGVFTNTEIVNKDKNKEDSNDVIMKLIESDRALVKRDLLARLSRVQRQ